MVVAYVPRTVDGEIGELLAALPALSLEGAKGVGKTETARRRAATVRRLDDPEQRELVAADPRRLLVGAAPVLIDEWQRLPESWDLVRRAVDDDHTAGRFLLTGSTRPGEAPTHSGAGRIVTVRMRPLSLAERGLDQASVSLAELLSGTRPQVSGATSISVEDYAREIVSSGFPGLRHLTGRGLRAQLDGYLDRIVEREFDEAGLTVRRPETLRRWMESYAAATASTASYEKIRDGATRGEGDKPAKTTTQPYREVLERLWVVESVPAWLPSRNPFSRMARSPKHHLCDPALAARLLDVDEGALLEAGATPRPAVRDGPLLGALFESLVTSSMRTYAQAAEATVRHFRANAGERETDLVVERGDRRIVAVEVKLARTVEDHDVRHLVWLGRRLGPDLLDAIVVTTGGEAYRRADGVAVIPAALLGP